MTFLSSRSRASQAWPEGHALRQGRGPRAGGFFREVFSALIMLTGVAGCGSLIYGLFHTMQPEPPGPGTAPSIEQPWAEIARPMQLFSLQSPEFGREPRLYEARRHRTGGGRQDVLTYGAEFGQGPLLRVSAYRIGSEGGPAPSFFVELARQAAQAGLAVTRAAQPVPLPTKFGSFETADVMLEADGRTAGCIAFRLEAQDVEFRLSGLACGQARAPDRASLVCIIDRLDLIAGSGDPALLRFFTTAEQTRGRTCGPKQPGSRTSWLDPAGTPPPLRNGSHLARIQP